MFRERKSNMPKLTEDDIKAIDSHILDYWQENKAPPSQTDIASFFDISFQKVEKAHRILVKRGRLEQNIKHQYVPTDKVIAEFQDSKWYLLEVWRETMQWYGNPANWILSTERPDGEGTPYTQIDADEGKRATAALKLWYFRPPVDNTEDENANG